MIHFWQSHLDFGLRDFWAKHAFIWDLFLNGTWDGGLGCRFYRRRNSLLNSGGDRRLRLNPNRSRRRPACVDPAKLFSNVGGKRILYSRYGGSRVWKRVCGIITNGCTAGSLTINESRNAIDHRTSSKALLLQAAKPLSTRNLTSSTGNESNQCSDARTDLSRLKDSLAQFLVRVVDFLSGQILKELFRRFLCCFFKASFESATNNPFSNSASYQTLYCGDST